MSMLHKGLSKSAPPVQDASRKLPKGPSVDAGATRSATAKTPKTLGPREA